MSIFDRLHKIASAFGQGLNPEDHIEDYGEFEEDRNAEEDARAWEEIDVDDDGREYDFPLANMFNRLFFSSSSEEEENEE